MHQYTSKFPTFPVNLFLPGVINGSEIMCVSSAVPSLSVKLPFWCRRPRPLHRGGSKVGSEATGAELRVAHNAFLTGLQTTGDNLQLCGWRQGTGEETQVWFHTLTCLRWNGDGGLLQNDSEKGGFSRCTCASPPAVGGNLLTPPCNQMWPYLGWLPAVVPASYDGWFISVNVRVFQYAKLNLTILN